MGESLPLATRQEVAEHLQVPEKTLKQWAHRGIGPRYRLVGRHARYEWSDVRDWLKKLPASGGRAA